MTSGPDLAAMPRLCECGCGEPTRAAQRTNTRFGHVRGAPLRFINGHQRRTPGPEWIVEDRGYLTPCRIWQHGHVTGYGVTKVDGRTRYTHVLAWEALNGATPPGKELDHLCQQRACGEPAHLDPVPHIVNTQRGPRVRLTPAAVLAIRSSGEPTAVLAGQFGVARRTILSVRSGDRWPNIAREHEARDGRAWSEVTS